MTTKKTRELILKIYLLKEEYTQREYSDAMLFVENNNLKDCIDERLKIKDKGVHSEVNRILDSLKINDTKKVKKLKNILHAIKDIPERESLDIMRTHGLKLDKSFEQNSTFNKTLNSLMKLLSTKEICSLTDITDEIVSSATSTTESYHALASYMIEGKEKHNK